MDGDRGDRYPPLKSRGSFSLFNGHMIHPIFRLMFGCFGGLGLIFFGGEDSDDGMMLLNRVDCFWVVVFFSLGCLFGGLGCALKLLKMSSSH